MVCRNFIDNCINEVEKLGDLCPLCKENLCSRCDIVALPQLILNKYGECEGCAGYSI